MHKLRKLAFNLSLSAFCVSGAAGLARGDEPPARDESSWTSLVDEPSRADLFQN